MRRYYWKSGTEWADEHYEKPLSAQWNEYQILNSVLGLTVEQRQALMLTKTSVPDSGSRSGSLAGCV